MTPRCAAGNGVGVHPVRRLRLQVGLTQHLLAKAAGTGQSAISAYETGRISPTLATLERLAAAIGHHPVVTFEPVATRDENERPPVAIVGEAGSTVARTELRRDALWTL